MGYGKVGRGERDERSERRENGREKVKGEGKGEKGERTYEHASSPLSASWMKRDAKGLGLGVRTALAVRKGIRVGIEA